MPEEKGGTDMSDVFIALFSGPTGKALIVLLGFAILVWSGWASPENVRDIGETWLRAWRCQG